MNEWINKKMVYVDFKISKSKNQHKCFEMCIVAWPLNYSRILSYPVKQKHDTQQLNPRARVLNLVVFPPPRYY